MSNKSILMYLNHFSIVSLCLLTSVVHADLPKGNIHTLSTKNGNELCIVHSKMPDANYSKKDLESEQLYCSVDFYSDKIALCAKLDSTSPGTFIYSLEDETMTRAEAEKSCATLAKTGKKISNYKPTMNQHGTSACNSNGSIMAYHFARYFDTHILVPAAVYRTFDRMEHYNRVSKNAVGKGAMIQKAWDWMRIAETKPETYSEKSLLFTPDLTQITGSMYKLGGERYPSYINGVRKVDQYSEFLETPPFMALRSEGPLSEAITVGLSVAGNSQFKGDLAFEPTKEQMVMWMQDLVEISVLDVIFAQQDRVGNIDYIWAWAYKDGEKVKYKNLPDDDKELTRAAIKIKKLTPPSEISNFNPILIQRTVVKDNDAGGLARYLNRADGKTGKVGQTESDKKKRNYINKIHHINSNFYTKLQKLARDMDAKGPIYEYIGGTFGLSNKDFEFIVANIKSVAAQLHESCINNKLNFDLDYAYYFTSGGQVKVDAVSCDIL